MNETMVSFDYVSDWLDEWRREAYEYLAALAVSAVDDDVQVRTIGGRSVVRRANQWWPHDNP